MEPDETLYECGCCGGMVPAEQMRYTVNEDVCVECYDAAYRPCRGCGNVYHDDDRRQSADGDSYCAQCYRNRFSQCCDCGCELDTHFDQIHETGCNSATVTEVACEDCYNNRNTVCGACDTEVQFNESCEAPNGDRYCCDCYSRECAGCRNCGRPVWRDEAQCVDGDYFCDRCLPPNEWHMQDFAPSEVTYDEIRSNRRYGIEIETHSCPNHLELREDTVYGCKPDGSVDGMEFVSPVLYADQGLEETRKVCRFARQNEWTLSSACGLHVHLDCTDESDDNLKKIALAYHFTYDLWTSFVSDSRKANYYCAKHNFDANDLRMYNDFYSFIRHCIGGTRYEWVNFNAYNSHRTIEIRFHSATLNPTKISNWVKAHSRFMDRVTQMSMGEITRKFAGRETWEQFAVLADLWDDAYLAAFYASRAEQFGKPVTHPVEV